MKLQFLLIIRHLNTIGDGTLVNKNSIKNLKLMVL